VGKFDKKFCGRRYAEGELEVLSFDGAKRG